MKCLEEKGGISEESEGDDIAVTATSPPTTTTSINPAQPEVVSEAVVSVARFWRLHNIRHTVNKLLAAWDEVSIDTINHSWRRLAPDLYKEREDSVFKIRLAASIAARALPGCSDVAVEEVIEVAEATDNISVNTILEQVNQ